MAKTETDSRLLTTYFLPVQILIPLAVAVAVVLILIQFVQPVTITENPVPGIEI